MAEPTPITIRILTPHDAANETTVSTLVALVNEAFLRGEGAFWAPGRFRTNNKEFIQHVLANEMFTATGVDGSLIGAVKLHGIPDTRIADIGMLAVSSSQRRSGLGRKLVDYAEAEARKRGFEIGQVDVLTPTEGNDAFKDILIKWYKAMGYQFMRSETLEEAGLAFLRPDLIRPAEHVVYQKKLVGES